MSVKSVHVRRLCFQVRSFFLYVDENHVLQEERDKAYQKIGNLSLGTEDMETRYKISVSNAHNIVVKKSQS